MFLLLTVFLPVSCSKSKKWYSEESDPMQSEIGRALISSVTAGARVAMQECSALFKTELWNCPDSAFRRGRDERGSNREDAFINSITAAGIVHTVASNCSRGDIPGCECDSLSSANGWKWGGCSHNVRFGNKVSREFLDRFERSKDPKSIASRHNYNAGRVGVEKTLKTLCKCHGVSGSCSTQTCWRQVSDFKTVGIHLKQQYKKALRVDYFGGKLDLVENIKSNKIQTVFHIPSGLVRGKIYRQRRMRRRGRRKRTSRARRKGHYLQQRRKKERRTAHQRKREGILLKEKRRWRGVINEPETRKERKFQKAGEVKKRKLVYLERSPDYCRRNQTLGLQGALGRECMTDPSLNSPSEDNLHKCSRLCRDCGLYTLTREVEVTVSCNCRFVWCCRVECQSCTRLKQYTTCTNSHRSVSPNFPPYNVKLNYRNIP